jgi:predicted ester cyclase
MSPNEALVREACRVIWSEGQVDRVAEFYAEDFVADYPMTDWGVGLEGIKTLASSIRVGFPDYREEIVHLVDGGDLIAVELRLHATNTGPLGMHPPTGRAVTFRDMTLLRLRDGRIVEQRGLTDHASLFAQLGLPMPSAA